MIELEKGAVDMNVYLVEEVAEILRVSKRKVYEIIAQRQLKVVRIGKSIRVPRQYLDEYVKSQVEGG